MELSWSRHRAGCSFTPQQPLPQKQAAVSGSILGVLDNDPGDSAAVLVQGLGDAESYVLTSPHGGPDECTWVSLELANTPPNREGVREFTRRFGLLFRGMNEDHFYANRDAVWDALACMKAGGWKAATERIPSIVRRGGRSREPVNVVEFIYRELQSLDEDVRLCRWEPCGHWYVPSKHRKTKHRFCTPRCNREWEKAKSTGPPRVTVAIDCIEGDALDDGAAILIKYISANGDPESFEPKLAEVGVALQPRSLIPTLRRLRARDRKRDLLRIARALELISFRSTSDSGNDVDTPTD